MPYKKKIQLILILTIKIDRLKFHIIFSEKLQFFGKSIFYTLTKVAQMLMVNKK